jgi:pyruvate,water dikinase
LDAVRVVWASLWSDAALLYRKELRLDPRKSSMAVLIQPMFLEDRSGVAFGRDPRDNRDRYAIIEAVPGLGSDLVDGRVEPDHWRLDAVTGAVLEWRPGKREGQTGSDPILTSADLQKIYEALVRVRDLFGWAPDLEWTGRSERFTLLQARPITETKSKAEDLRGWYLTLRPKREDLKRLCDRVSRQLIPELQQEGARLARASIEELGDPDLASSLRARIEAFERWKKIYWNEFIPFAHGVRHFGRYYNDLLRPEDPYEFTRLLRGQEMIALRRNRELSELASALRRHPEWCGFSNDDPRAYENWRRSLAADPAGRSLLGSFDRLAAEFMDVAYAGTRLGEKPSLIFSTVMALARFPQETGFDRHPDGKQSDRWEADFLASVGPEREEEARELLEIARISWRLRDDDNLLLGRVESQMLRALAETIRRLKERGQLPSEAAPGPDVAERLVSALLDEGRSPTTWDTPSQPTPVKVVRVAGTRDRQLIGQPAAPGLFSGNACLVQGAEDLPRFRPGAVLVCDALQPMMSHLVPLAAAVVERRGGMLIHGAIIARELGIPCVNGVEGVTDRIEEGDLLTVDGSLGIVTIGLPEFDLEREQFLRAGGHPVLGDEHR